MRRSRGPFLFAMLAIVAWDAGTGKPLRAETKLVATGKEDRRLVRFDQMARKFLERHQVPGLALAVTDRGCLVHARGYGYADRERKEKVLPTSLFRIASISKPITAVAVLQLAERKKLSLEDKVFDILDGEPHFETGARWDARQEEITLRQLLQHRGGWDRAQSFDAMFQSVRFARELGVPPPAGPDEIIRCMLGQRLDFPPGERYAYSNYGYCLLGRVIEEVTGQDYEEYVKQQVLAPLGIRSMCLGKTRLPDRRPGEVKYYHPEKGKSVFSEDLGERVAQPYGAWYLEAMDAHGGWLGSVVDLARFASAFDDPKRCKVIRESSVQEMFTRPPGAAGHEKDGTPKTVYYGCGWQVRVVGNNRRNQWHSGSLPGTAALLVRRHDGRNWVVLMNARVSPHTSHLGKEIDRLVHRAADAVTEWPEYDLFQGFPEKVTEKVTP
ncbi:MAG: serine hydrolase domain-containing protein [Pirellulaceae bacterium]